jgi:hypothetical protein
VNLVETQTTPVSVAASQTESVTSQPVFRQSDSIRLCMVDFAHCLTKRRSDDIRRRAEERSVQMAIQGGADALLMREEQGTLQGPDGGYLTGLDTLIELFQAIFNHCNSLHGSPNMVNCRQQSVADEINLARSLARTVSLSSVPEEDSPHPKSSRIRQTALQQPKPRAISISTGFAVPSQPSLATSPVTVMHSSSSDPFSTAGDHDADGKDLEAVGERRKRSTIAVLNKFVEARERFEGGRS